MKISKVVFSIMIVGVLSASTAFSQDTVQQPTSALPTAFENLANTEFDNSDYYTQDSESVSHSIAHEGTSCDSCGSSDCGGGCGRSLDLGSRLGCCDLGEPWSLWDQVACDSCINVGMWTQMGYHDEGNGLTNNHPDRLNLHQQYIYIEKEAHSDGCCWDWGFRFDAMYGVDGDRMQAFGSDAGDWDFMHGYDHGIYGWALPQFYGEFAYNRLNLIAGHFYSPSGYERATAPDNFFYSHSMSHSLTTPITYTGVLATYDWREGIELVGGYSSGWDVGFSQFGGGNNFFGGFIIDVNECLSFTYIVNGGDFGRRSLDDEKSYSHNIVVDWQINDRWNYVLESSALRIEEQGEDNVGITNYLFYDYSDCLAFGARVEWWKGDSVTNGGTGYTYGGRIPALTNGSSSYYGAAFGVNYRPCANIVIRPEVRRDWAPFAGYDETTFAVDFVATY